MLVCYNCGETYKRRHWTQGFAETRIMFQCSGYVDGNIGERCPSKAISEDILLKATCDVINRIYVKRGKNYNMVLENIARGDHGEDYKDQIDEATSRQIVLETEIDDIIKKKGSTTDDVEKIILEKQYRERITEYHKLEKLVLDLTQKQQDADYAKIRIRKMGYLLRGQELTPETITKQIVETFIQSIIVIDKHELVFVLPGEEKANYQYIKDNRERLVNKKAIINGNIHLDRKLKPEDLRYKVVMI